MSSADHRREIGFGLGTFVGAVFVALGLSMTILFLSIGLRVQQGTYLSPGLKRALLIGGVVALFLGGAIRLYRSELSTSDRVLNYLGTGLMAAGALGVLVGLARQTTQGAPFLTSPTQKFLVLGIAIGFLVVGGVLIRLAARAVGW